MNYNINLDPVLKRFAWITLSGAGLCVIALSIYIYFTVRAYSSRRENDRITFNVKLDGTIRSFSKSKISINGVYEYFDVNKDSVAGLQIKTKIKNGFRPTGKVVSNIYTINGAAVELRIDYKEGFSNQTTYDITPHLISCDSLCKEYAFAYKELDTLNSRTRRLSKIIYALSPKGVIDTAEFNASK